MDKPQILMNRTIIAIRIEFQLFYQGHTTLVKNPDDVEEVENLIKYLSDEAYIKETSDDFITVQEWEEKNWEHLQLFVKKCNE